VVNSLQSLVPGFPKRGGSPLAVGGEAVSAGEVVFAHPVFDAVTLWSGCISGEERSRECRGGSGSR
jgi:hypothetical protein